MNIAREAVFDALFALLGNAAAFVTKEQGFKLWSQVNEAARPALFMVEKEENYSLGGKGNPTLTILQVDVFIYVWTKNKPNPAKELNKYLDALDKALKPALSMSQLTSRQNLGLGANVFDTYQDGRVVKIPGYLDGDGMGIVPIKIVCP